MSTDNTPATRTGWAKAFFDQGFRGQPWVILKRSPPSAEQAERIIGEALSRGGGWLPTFFTYEVLHAPAFEVWASPQDQERVVTAIEAFPIQRAAHFQTSERPLLEAFGLPAPTIEDIAPRADQPLHSANFRWPILAVEEDPVTNGFVLTGRLSSLNMLFASVVGDPAVQIDQALALSILLTCHGDPGVDFAKSPFARPLHPDRLRQVHAALRERHPEADQEFLAAEIRRLLLVQVPQVVTSLRQTPPRTTSLHRAARSRLAERVSDDALPGRRSRPRQEPWWRLLEALPGSTRRRYLRSLTPGERDELRARQQETPTARRPTTARVLMHRAKSKLRVLLGTPSPSPS